LISQSGRHEAGLHARPATIFIQKASNFAAKITISKEEKTVDAKSILKVLTLGWAQGNSGGWVWAKHARTRRSAA